MKTCNLVRFSLNSPLFWLSHEVAMCVFSVFLSFTKQSFELFLVSVYCKTVFSYSHSDMNQRSMNILNTVSRECLLWCCRSSESSPGAQISGDDPHQRPVDSMQGEGTKAVTDLHCSDREQSDDFKTAITQN